MMGHLTIGRTNRVAGFHLVNDRPLAHQLNDEYLFIGGWYMPQNVCDGLLDYYNESPNKVIGRANNGDTPGVFNDQVKRSTDVSFTLPTRDIRLNRYVDCLQSVLSLYKERYDHLEIGVSSWGFVEPLNIQHYEPGEGFLVWHAERTGVLNANRLLVFMTYLNDVTDGGETEWKYLGLRVKPEKGLTVVWSADWMHTHRGVKSPTQEKTIITGWLSFIGD